MAVNSGVKTVVPLSYTVPVPVMSSKSIWVNTEDVKIEFNNVNKSDVKFDNLEDKTVGFNTATVSLRDTTKQKWSDNTTAPKTYTYEVRHRYQFDSPLLTDSELNIAVRGAYNGQIDLENDYNWQVGQKRPVHLSAIPASGTNSAGISYTVGESHAEQDATLVLLHKGGLKNLDGTDVKYVFGLLNCLEETGRVSYPPAWGINERSKWCNIGFYNALPSNIQGAVNVKQMKIQYPNNADQNATLSTVACYFALPSNGETVTHDNTNYKKCPQTEWNATFQLDYYKNNGTSKKLGDDGTNTEWLTRSPLVGYWDSYVVLASGNHAVNYNSYGLSPYGTF